MLANYKHQYITPGDAAKCTDVPFNAQQIGYLASVGLFEYTTYHHTKLILVSSLKKFIDIVTTNGILIEKKGK